MIREAGNHWSTSVISHEYLKSHKDVPCPDFSSCGKELWCWGDSRGNQLTSATEPREGTELGRGRKYFLIVVALCSVYGCLCLLQILKDLQRMSQAFPECWKDGYLVGLNCRHVCDQIKQIPEESFSRCIYDIRALFRLHLESEGPFKSNIKVICVEWGFTLKKPDINSQLYQWTILQLLILTIRWKSLNGPNFIFQKILCKFNKPISQFMCYDMLLYIFNQKVSQDLFRD